MSANIGDRFTETFNGQNPTSTTVSGPRAILGSTLTCTSLAGWPTTTAVHFATYQKDATGAKIAGSQVDWKGIVSGSSVNTLTRQGGAADGGNAVGDIVEMMPTYSWANDLAKGLENTLNADGTLQTGIVTSAKIADATITGTDIAAATIAGSNLQFATVKNAQLGTDISPANFTNPYKFSVYRNAALSLATGAVVVTFDTKTFDTGSNVDIVTNKGRFAAPIAGFYFFTSSVSVTQGNPYTYQISIYKNGSAVLSGNELTSANSNGGAYVVSGLVQLAANDYVEIYASTSNPGGQAINVGASSAYFQGFLVSGL